MTSHCITWHDTTQGITSHDVTITWPDPATDIKTSKHLTSKHKTSPPWNGRRLVHSKEMIWASRWSVALRTFYRQILFVLYSSFPFGNFRPRLVRALLVYSCKLQAYHLPTSWPLPQQDHDCQIGIDCHDEALLEQCLVAMSGRLDWLQQLVTVKCLSLLFLSAGQTAQQNGRQIEPSYAHNGTHRYVIWCDMI